MLLAGLAPENIENPPHPLALLLSYCGLLGLIFLQNRFLKKNLYTLSQFEILLFLFLSYFVFNASALLAKSQFLSALFLMTLYLFATGFYYVTSSKSLASAKKQVKILIPFALPFLIFTLLTDTARILGFDPLDNLWLSVVLIALSALFLALGFPPLICKLWECTPLEKSEVKIRLENVCKRAQFAHAGLKNWNLFATSPTAAILGILPKFRYILFTPSLLKNLSPEALEAVLAHEIGHSKHRHLLFFPFVLFGMVLFVSFLLDLALYYLPAINHPALLFLLTAFFLAFYFRFILGFFSRLFERQADLYGMQIGIPFQAMIEALDTVGNLTGYSHKLPNWHHFSIAERIQFIKEVGANPLLADRYHTYVRNVQIIFIILLVIASILFFL